MAEDIKTVVRNRDGRTNPSTPAEAIIMELIRSASDLVDAERDYMGSSYEAAVVALADLKIVRDALTRMRTA